MRALFLAVAFAGCASGMTPVYTNLSPEQLKELVKDKNSLVNCIRAMYAGVSLTMVYVNADKGISSDVMLTEDCKLTMKATNPNAQNPQ